MQEPIFPKHENDLTPELLTSVLSQDRPGLEVTDFKVVEAIRAMSGQASTADRVILDLTYRAGPESAGLPRRIILKTMLDVPHAPQVMYETESVSIERSDRKFPLKRPSFSAPSSTANPAISASCLKISAKEVPPSTMSFREQD